MSADRREDAVRPAVPLRTAPTSAARRPRVAALAAVLVAGSILHGQTTIEPPKNRFTPAQDVELGREAASEVRRQYPIITNGEIQGYLNRIGRRLVEHAPRRLDHDVFEYSFTPVNLKEINAFALPGGPMFVNRGMLEAASREGEVAGVMAHELAHVLLRHGTANATKAQKFQLGALAGAIAGAVIGGGWGQVISEGSQFGLGTWLLKYSREYERQADLLGAQIMARAGYDPRDLGRMFETIQRQSRSGAPEWLSSHPDPGNRSAYIAREAAQLRVAPAPNDGSEFDAVRRRLASLPKAQSMAELARRGGSREAPAEVGSLGSEVPPPAREFRTVRGGRLVQLSVPRNWEDLASNSSIKFVPRNAYGQMDGESVFTHGVEVGVTRAASRDLREATEALVQALASSNPDLRLAGSQRRVQIARRAAIETPLVNRSALGGQEQVGLYTTFLADGSLFYYLTIVPATESRTYEPVFQRVAQSIRLNDR